MVAYTETCSILEYNQYGKYELPLSDYFPIEH